MVLLLGCQYRGCQCSGIRAVGVSAGDASAGVSVLSLSAGGVSDGVSVLGVSMMVQWVLKCAREITSGCVTAEEVCAGAVTFGGKCWRFQG